MTRRGATGRAAALALALAPALVLGACSSSGPGFFQRLGSTAMEAVAPEKAEEAEAPRQLTRAELNEIPYATIAVSRQDSPRAFLVPLADNAGYLDYRDSSGRSVRMLGGAVVGSAGLVYALAALRVGRRDPVAHETPLAEWPEQIYREYQYRVHETGKYGITLSCTYQPVARETIEIVEINFDLMRVSEVCTNQRRQVTNTYWVEEDTGFIWKSEQWLGPEIEHLTVEIIRPHAG